MKNKMATNNCTIKPKERVTITRNLLKQRFEEYNNLYFEGQLSMPRFYYLMCDQPYARCNRYKKGDKKMVDIWINKRTKWTEEALKETLIHEMTHQYVYEVQRGWRKTFVQHGPKFIYMKWKLHRKYGVTLRPN